MCDEFVKVFGLLVECVMVNVMLLGGGFGCKLKFDYVVEVVLLLKVVGVFVKLIFMCEDDIVYDYFYVVLFEVFDGGIDVLGKVVVW